MPHFRRTPKHFHPHGYQYPIRGIVHFLHHIRRFSSPIALPLTKGLVLSSATIIPLFRYGFHPQANAIKLLLSRVFFRHAADRHPLLTWAFAGAGVVSATILCLGESYAIWTYLVGGFLSNIPRLMWNQTLQDHSFVKLEPYTETPEEAVMTAKTRDHYLSTNHLIILYSRDPAIEGDFLYWRQFFCRPILFIVTLPLNSIPFLGFWVFLFLNGLPLTGAALQMYLSAKKMTTLQRRRYVKERYRACQSFGIVATWLEMVPILGIVFVCTNQIGAALWAIDEEQWIQKQKAVKLQHEQLE
ncbi:hypothetical protein BC938DRAFT_479270 [Jimgerdemannia flammicorona]|uniref:Etoposide-induced protein 2.4-domain-containing protein n=1 Tax=Jimgerdemannia flammicorona TaxID=994334 RepID=A0A433QL85_9FUNG|nr:hypothetical protein BC938DRAFT_479270 [Jimgerdemannia flammicorona]